MNRLLILFFCAPLRHPIAVTGLAARAAVLAT